MKTSIDQLAIFGGTPLFAEMLHVGRPNIGNRERLLARINEVLDRRWLTNAGPLVQEFEHRVQEFLGVRHCVAMCNGTVALEIMIRALDLRGEVIVPSFTFVATAHALQWQEITPVFADVDPRTHCLDPAAVERMITPRTTGILGVHVWGRPCAVDALTEIAERRRLKLIFDASHAFGCAHRGRRIGNFGAAEVFSFHATKVLNTFEGGAVVTNNDELAAKMRLMKNFGFADLDSVIYIGTNGKMSEISAAMGLTGLESFGEFVEANRRNYETCRRELRDVPGLRLHNQEDIVQGNCQYIVLELDERETGIGRDQLVKLLHAERIRARRYFYPGVHRMEPYRSYFPHAGLLLPQTEALCQRVVLLPTGTGINTSDMLSICALLRFVLERSQEIRAALDARVGSTPG